MPIDDFPDGARLGRDVSSPAPTVRKTSTAFGSPGSDSTVKRIDLNEALIRHPESTFIVRASGNEMTGAGIGNGDMLLVDHDVRAAHGAIVIALLDGVLLCRRLDIMSVGPGKGHGAAHRIRLVAEDGVTPAIQVTAETVLEVRGVVTTIIKCLLVEV